MGVTEVLFIVVSAKNASGVYLNDENKVALLGEVLNRLLGSRPRSFRLISRTWSSLLGSFHHL